MIEEIDALYKKVKTLKEKVDLKAEVFRGEIIECLMDAIIQNKRISHTVNRIVSGLSKNNIDVWPRDIWETPPMPKKKRGKNKKVHVIPEGFMLVKPFSKENQISCEGYLQTILNMDGDARHCRLQVGKHVYVHKQNMIDFLDSEVGRVRYKRLAPQIDAYKERLNEHKRQGEVNS